MEQEFPLGYEKFEKLREDPIWAVNFILRVFLLHFKLESVRVSDSLKFSKCSTTKFFSGAILTGIQCIFTESQELLLIQN